MKETTKDAFLIIRLTTDLKKKLMKLAQKNGVKLAEIVRPALEKLV